MHAVLGQLACQADAQRVVRPRWRSRSRAGDAIPRPVSRLIVRWLPPKSADGVRTRQRSRIAAERAFSEVDVADRSERAADGPRLPFGCREGRR